jgi:hypothetical protein
MTYGTAKKQNDTFFEKDKWDQRYLPIPVEYSGIIDRLSASCDLLLQRSNLLPSEIDDVGRLKYALGRLPLCTDGVHISVSLTYVTDKEGSWEGSFLELSSKYFGISDIAYFRGPHGGVSDCRTIFSCKNSGYRSDTEDRLARVYNDLEGWVELWQTKCCDTDMTLKIDDAENNFDWYQEEDEDAWEKMPNNYF